MNFLLKRERLVRAGLFVSLGLLVLLASYTTITDYDFWWHLKKGEVIASSGAIRHADTFSYTFNGQPDAAGEWLADLLIYQAYRVGGYEGVNLFKAALLAGAFFFLLGALVVRGDGSRRRLLASVLVVALAVLAVRFRFFIRPYLFSYLFFCVFLYLLARFRQTGKTRHLFLLCVVQLAWSNSSSGALFGLLLAGLYAVSRLASRSWDRRLAPFGLLLATAYLLNPDGAAFLQRMAGLVTGSTPSSSLSFVGEHQPLSPSLLWGHGVRYTMLFQVITVLALVELLFFKGWKKGFQAGLFVVFLGMACWMIRLVSFSCMASSMLAVSLVERLFRFWRTGNERAWVKLEAWAAVVILAVAVSSAWGSRIHRFGSGPEFHTFPDGALAFLEEHQVAGVMFNSYPFGGYLAWKAPDRKVFIDGRAGHLYSPEFIERYLSMLRDPLAWEEAAAAWGFDYALVEYDLRDGGKHFPFHLVENPGWALVYWDRHSAVLVRRQERFSRLIEAFAYRVTRPALNDFTYLDTFGRTPGRLGETSRQLRREIEQNPDNQEPRLARAYLLLNFGNTAGREAGFQELQACLAMEPDLAFEHVAHARILLERGDRASAGAALEKALSLDPSDEAARELLLGIEQPAGAVGHADL